MTLHEAVSFADAQVEDGCIKNVKVLGEKSKNGRSYPLSTRQRAHGMIEGLRVNLDHADKRNPDVSVHSRIGKLVNVREGQGGTYADFQFLSSHPFAGQLLEAAKRLPDLYGFSINGSGSVKTNKAGEHIVENIDNLKSVDLVANPGTVKSLFESEDTPEAKSCETIIGELVAALVAEGKEEFVKDVIKLKKKISGSGDDEEAPEEAPNDEADEAPAQESWRQEYKQLKLEKNCRELLESNNLTHEPELLESLMAMNNEEARTKFLQWHKKKANVKTPRSGASVEIPTTKLSKDWASILRGA